MGLKLQEARKNAGLTQQELCQKSGLSYSTLAKIERGAIKSPSIFTIQQIAGVLNMSLDELIGVRNDSPAHIAKKRSKSGISFVYFDINGCLVRFFHRAFTTAAKDFGLPSDIVESTYWHYTDAVCRGDMTLEEFNRASAERFSQVNNTNIPDFRLVKVLSRCGRAGRRNPPIITLGSRTLQSRPAQQYHARHDRDHGDTGPHP